MACGTGYTLNFDTGRCEDNDECAVGTHNCDALGPGYLCRNIQVAGREHRQVAGARLTLQEHPGSWHGTVG